MITIKRNWIVLILVSSVLSLAGCGSSMSSEDRIATQVAEARAVAATLTVEAAQAANRTEAAQVGTATQTAPAVDPPPASATPTKVVVASLPTDTPLPTDTATSTPIPTNTPTQIVAAPSPTITATSTPIPINAPTQNAAPPPTQTPLPTPTQIVAAPLPVPGASNLVRSTDPSNGGLNILLPGFAPNEITDPMVFRDRIGMALSIYSVNASTQDPGDGIQQVTFEVRDQETFEVVYEKTEMSSLYCLFGGNTVQECMPLTFAQLNYQWPNGQPIYNGEYEVNIFIETDDDSGSWNPTIVIQGALARPGQSGANFSGSWLTNAGLIDFQQAGNEVSGSYQIYGDSQWYRIDGVVSGQVLEGTYTGNDGGTIRFELSQDGQRFDGSWFYRGEGQANHWCGVRSGPLWDGCGYSGSWESIGDYRPEYQPTMQLSQTGDRVQGTFLNGLSNDPGTINGQVGTEGSASQLTAVGQWTVGNAAGTFRWRLANLQSNQLMGRSTTADGRPHQWCGWRPGVQPPTVCFE